MSAALAQMEAIVHAHAALGLPSHADAQAHPVDHSTYAVAFAAARRLGFMVEDAECVAQAWNTQSARTGAFHALDWPSHPHDFGLRAPPPGEAFVPCPKLRGLYAVLPTAAWVARMAAAGVRTVQLRFKSRDPQAIRAEVEAAVAAVQGTACSLFINDHWEEAIRAGAYGVHLGQEDLDSANLNAIRKAGLRLGLSTHGYAEIQRAHRLAPSYIALGAVYPTTLKQMPTPPQGSARLRAYARLLQGTPVVAIGGIDLARLPTIANSGVDAFAVVRAITAAADPEAAVHELEQAFARHTEQKNDLQPKTGENGTII
ncbi:thiamine phosphate synthase [Hydrogenophaga sp.]|uniref:thiamine phosphate synthase n=1 Tax=Hydrogenophaga sp. TaxID=1904254 RepID=UPI00356AC75B